MRELMEKIVDYAGMFPPAALSLAEAEANFASYREHPRSWMLNRFVVPAARLGELRESTRPLALLLGEAWQEEVALAADPRVEAVELRLPAGAPLEGLAALGRPVFCEVAAVEDVLRLRQAGLGLKIRTGPVPPEPEVLASVLAVARGLPLKFTAGLHRAVRHDGQFGFLNVFAAAMLAAEGLPAADLVPVLEAAEFDLSDGLRVQGHHLPVARVAELRRRVASFGSCSFLEPVESLEALIDG